MQTERRILSRTYSYRMTHKADDFAGEMNVLVTEVLTVLADGTLQRTAFQRGYDDGGRVDTHSTPSISTIPAGEWTWANVGAYREKHGYAFVGETLRP